jgi:hypothetical protein
MTAEEYLCACFFGCYCSLVIIVIVITDNNNNNNNNNMSTDQNTNYDDEIEVQRIQMEKIMIVDYKSTEGTFTGSLTPSKVASMMMGAPYLAQQGVTFQKKDDEEAPPKYFIMLRNTNTGKECLHYEAVDTLEGWHMHFINQPILEGINIMKEPKFPPLRAPNGHEELWTHTFMIKGRDRFMAVVTSTCPWMETEPIDSLKPCRDIVVVNAMSPLLPSTHIEYKKIKSSQSRKSCAMQYAFKLLGEKCGFKCTKRENNLSESVQAMMASILHGNEVVNDSGW